jgi:hypothetical protein
MTARVCTGLRPAEQQRRRRRVRYVVAGSAAQVAILVALLWLALAPGGRCARAWCHRHRDLPKGRCLVPACHCDVFL